MSKLMAKTLDGDPPAPPRPPRKVLFVLEDLLIGGAQRHSMALLHELKSQFELRALCLGAKYSPSVVTSDLEAQIRVLGLSGMANPATWRRLARYLESESPSLIVTVNQIATLAVTAALLMSRVRCPVAVVFHSTDVKNVAGWIQTAPFFPAVWMANAIVYVSANQKALWTRRGLRSRRIEMIRNGIDASRFAPPDAGARQAARNRLGFSDQDYVVGLSAVFRHEKNHQQLIEAIARLREQGIPARALLVGDGPKRPEIERLAASRGIGDSVVFAGMQPDVRPYLAAVDVGVNCSTSIETLSLAALEYMATGLPMIMSDIGGASEIVDQGQCGFLFPAGNTAALVDHLRWCADGAARERLGQEALKKVRRQFSDAAMVERYAQLFEALTQVANGRRATR